MLPHDVYFIDLQLIDHIFSKNIWYIVKILMVSYLIFYWLPLKIFPQEYTGEGIQKVVFNFVYMVSYVEVVMTFLIFIKIFSILIFILVLIMTKLAFMKWYYKKDLKEIFFKMRFGLMTWFLDFLDKPAEMKASVVTLFKSKVLHFQQSITVYSLLKQLLFYSIFIYIIFTLMARGMLSYSDTVADTSQFIDWVDSLQQNTLFADNKTFGADFYGQAIIIYFVNLFTNIDQIILFSLYPVLLLLALYFSIYYVVKDFTHSKYVALFAVMIHGIVLMSPLSNLFLGQVVTTSAPLIVSYFNFHFYMPDLQDLVTNANEIGNVPYIRYIAGLAYEHASVFVFLNAYFLIKVFETHLKRYLYMYGLTLMLVFTFHGGGAIILAPISVLIALNAILFRKMSLPLLKQGTLFIIIATVIGNLWMLAMIKYGIPQDFGAAAPFIDKLLNTKNNVEKVVSMGNFSISIINITKIHLALFMMIVLAYILSLLTTRRFVNSSILLIVIGTFVVYFGTNAGLPLLAQQSRLAEYLFFAITLLFAFYFFYFFYKPIILMFKKYARAPLMIATYLIFIFFILILPTWINTNYFWKSINEIGYTSAPETILKINEDNRPFSWTVIAYVQEYAKIRNKGYHVNTQDFLLTYSPQSKYLKIPTPKVYLFLENYPNPYMGLREWYYRWKPEIQSNFKSWIALYSMSHHNIKIYVKTKTLTVYEIDNSDYLDYLRQKEEEKTKQEEEKQ
jgi:hypothetical protein